MDDLIEALTLVRKYANPSSPTHCEHDILTVCVDPALVSREDLARLDRLGFAEEDGYFRSFRFGAA
jgi:hypothetical protein